MSEIKHYGVKGMKWGVRISRADKKKAKAATKAQNRSGETEFLERKLHRAFDAAQKDPNNTLIRTMFERDKTPVLRTGKDFIDHLTRGGAVNAKLTDLYATKNAEDGRYYIDEHFGEKFQKKHWKDQFKE